MRQVLPILREAIALPELKKNGVYVTPHVNIMPTGVKPPCLALAPGKGGRSELIAEMHERKLTVNLAAFVAMRGETEEVICDDKSPYALLDAACDRLDELTIPIPGLRGIKIGDDSAPTVFNAENKMRWVQVTRQLTITLER